jgi:hypothetical protein
LIGDVPYSEEDATNGYVHLIEELNQADPGFTVHVGDIKSGSTPCTDEWFTRCYEQFQTFRHPVVFLFGDNEWSDCGKVKEAPRDPEECLAKLREVFTQGHESLGQRKMLLARQSDDARFGKFRENVRWVWGNVQFVGLNVPGDANNYGQREFAERNRANLAWLEESFAHARAEERAAVMVLMQANPRFDLQATNRVRAGFNDLIALLEKETLAFAKPVVLVHGDTHYFRIDKPLVSARSRRRIEQFTRVETFGNPDIHWIRVKVDARDPDVFTFHPQIVRKNCIPHPR